MVMAEVGYMAWDGMEWDDVFGRGMFLAYSVGVCDFGNPFWRWLSVYENIIASMREMSP